MREPRSLQEVLKRRKQGLFVGRDRELESFAANLALPLDDDRRRFVFQVYGQGGVGKSSLLSRFQQLAENAGYACARADENHPDVPIVLGHLGAQLDARGRGFGEFLDRHRKYRQARQELEADPNAPRGLPALIGGIVGKGGVTLGRRIPIAGAALDFVDPDAVGNQAGEWAAFVAGKLTNKDEVQLVLDPVGVLTPLFLDGMRKFCESHPVMLLFDTFERTSDALELWILGLIKGTYGEVPTSAITAIAGRDRPSPNLWEELDEIVTRIRLAPFTEDEAREYLSRKHITDDAIVSEIIRVTESLPLLIATLASAEPDDANSPIEVSGTAVECFLKWEEPNRRRVALAAAIPRRLNADVLSAVLGDDNVEDRFEWLKSMPFVSASSDGWVYHGLVRHQMLRYLRRESPAAWAELHSRLATYFDELAVEVSDSTEQSNRLEEALYHRLCENPEEYLTESLGLLVLPTKLRGLSTRRWATVLLQVGEDTESDLLRRWGRRAFEAAKARDEGRNGPVLDLISAVLAHPTLSQEHRAHAHVWRGFEYAFTGQFAAGLEDVDEAIRLGSRDADLFNIRALFCLGLGRPEDAWDSLERVTDDGTTASESNVGLATMLLSVMAGAPPDDEMFSEVLQAADSLIMNLDTGGAEPQEIKSIANFIHPIMENLLAVHGMPAHTKVGGLSSLESIVDSAFTGERESRLLALQTLKNIVLATRAWSNLRREAGGNVLPAEMEAQASRASILLESVSAAMEVQFSDRGVPEEQLAAGLLAVKVGLNVEIGLTLSRAGKYDQASEIFRAGLEAVPTDPMLIYNYAVAQVRAGGLKRGQSAVDSAVAALKDKLEVGGTAEIANYGLGGLEALLGHKDAALSYLRTAREAEDRVVEWAESDPAWSDLRNDDQFRAIIRR